MKNPDGYSAPDKAFIKNAFDSISSRYDLLNRVMSFGQADRWRKKACEILLRTDRREFEAGFDLSRQGPPFSGESQAASILDLGCGTGKFLECFLKEKTWQRAVGLDLSLQMLKKARETVRGNAVWLQQDFDTLPFPESSFDLVISAFALRSVQDLSRFFFEARRVLVPGGRVGFLELTRPPKFWHKILFFPYLRIFLPLMGRVMSGNAEAYQFLARSVESFSPAEKLLEELGRAGFENRSARSFSFGAVTFLTGQK